MPGTGPRFRCGGLSVALQTARLLSELRPTEVVTYRAREQSHPFLDDLLAQEDAPGQAMWLVSWGFDVPRLLKRLRGRLAVYQAHSSGYGFDLPPGIPVVAVSRDGCQQRTTVLAIERNTKKMEPVTLDRVEPSR